jgi:hypothetical protein
MYCRRLYREFPVFFVYTIFHVLSITGTLLSATGGPFTYFWTYWGFQLLDVFVSLAVVQEIYRHTFKPFAALQGLGEGLFQWAALVLCAVSILAGSAAKGSDSSRIMSAVLTLSSSADFVVVALLCLLYGLAGAFGIKWQKRVLELSLGLAVMTAVGAAATTVRSQLGEIAHPMYAMIKPLAYNVACAMWVIAVFSEGLVHSAEVGRFSHLAEWSKTVEEIGHK